MLHAFIRVVRFATQSMKRNLWLTIATSGTVVLTVVSLSFLLAIQIGISQILQSTEKQIDLSVYFYPETSDEQANSVIVALRSLPQVTDVTHISREKAFADYQEQAKGLPELMRPLEIIGDNPFGAYLIIKAKDINNYGKIIDELSKPQYKDLIESQQKHFEENRVFIQSFSDFARKVQLGALIVAIVFAFISTLMMFNAVRIAIYTHSQEISVMRLVGATNFFIRGPYLVELITYGVLAVMIGGGVFMWLLYLVQPYLNLYFGAGEIDLWGYFLRNAIFIFGGQLFVIVVLGVVGSSLAIRRYLKI